MVAWTHGDKGTFDLRGMGIREHGATGTWKCGDGDEYGHGDRGAWEHRAPEGWGHWCIETRGHSGMGSQGHKDGEGCGTGGRALLEGAAPGLGTSGCSGGLASWTTAPVTALVATAGEPYPLGHHGGNGAADLVVADVGGVGAQDHQEEADGQGHLEDGVQCHRGLETHEGQRRLLQEGCAAWGEDGMGRGSGVGWAQGHRAQGRRDTRAQGHGDMETWRHRSMGTWGHWDMEKIWGHRSVGTGKLGDTGIWRRGDTGAWGHGDIGIWRRPGDMETWGHWDMEKTWGHRRMGTWKLGDTGIRR